MGDPHPADEGEADEVAQVPGPVMFESLQQCFVPVGTCSSRTSRVMAIAKTPSEKASRRSVGRWRPWVPWPSADAVLATGVAPSFRRIDQLIVFCCDLRRARRQVILPGLRAAVDSVPPARTAGAASIMVRVPVPSLSPARSLPTRAGGDEDRSHETDGRYHEHRRRLDVLGVAACSFRVRGSARPDSWCAGPRHAGLVCWFGRTAVVASRLTSAMRLRRYPEAPEGAA